MMKEALLWSSLAGGKVECTACARKCKLPDGGRGFCFVRQNRGGKLYLAGYGKLNAVQLDPIEKKPFNHFMPGSYVLGIGTSSCNWGCQFCQNHNISKERDARGIDMGPEEVVNLAGWYGADGIAFTYNEPTIFIEYALDVAAEASKRGMFSVFVSNGYMTGDAIALMEGKIDAVVVNFKGNGEEKFSNKYEAVVSNDRVRESLVELKSAGIHIEVTDLVVPRVGDSLDACNDLTSWIAGALGPGTPVHFNRFHPEYKMLDYPETPYDTLLKHYDIARNNGLHYVYIGNVPGGEHESTVCPGCGNVVVGRNGFDITGWGLDSGSLCARCGYDIGIVGKMPAKTRYKEMLALY